MWQCQEYSSRTLLKNYMVKKTVKLFLIFIPVNRG